MKTSVLLVITTVVLVVTSNTDTTLDPNLTRVLHLAHNASLAKDSKRIFVEDVEALVSGSGRCHKTFFCKVQKILEKHLQHEEIIRRLEVFNKCGDVKLEKTNGGAEIELHKLMDHLKTCIQHHNYHPKTTSRP